MTSYTKFALFLSIWILTACSPQEKEFELEVQELLSKLVSDKVEQTEISEFAAQIIEFSKHVLPASVPSKEALQKEFNGAIKEFTEDGDYLPVYMNNLVNRYISGDIGKSDFRAAIILLRHFRYTQNQEGANK